MSIESPRHINTVRAEEADQYLAITGWRIWVRNIFDGLSPKGAEYLAGANDAGAKDLALICSQFGRGYAYVYRKLDAIERALHPNRPRLPFGGPGSGATDMPWYLLEPLTQEEVAKIDELGEVPGPVGSIDRPDELLRPDELQRIFSEPDRRISGSVTIEMFKPKSSTPLEQTQDPPRIHYRFDRFRLNGRTSHYVHVLYGSESFQGAQLAEAHYTEGKVTSVAFKYGTKEDLLEKYNRTRMRRRSFVFPGMQVFPNHAGVALVVRDGKFEVYDDESYLLGNHVGTIKVGESFTHSAIPYVLEISSGARRMEFKRINPSDNSIWELSVPNEVPINGPEEISVKFKG